MCAMLTLLLILLWLALIVRSLVHMNLPQFIYIVASSRKNFSLCPCISPNTNTIAYLLLLSFEAFWDWGIFTSLGTPLHKLFYTNCLHYFFSQADFNNFWSLLYIFLKVLVMLVTLRRIRGLVYLVWSIHQKCELVVHKSGILYQLWNREKKSLVYFSNIIL